ncbi:MAG TPA: GtrA family protein [Anaerolineales bacterium]|nr:GtrA family protein [Anaerolineales bacterium]
MTLTSIITNPRERTRFFRFAAVGIFGAVVDFGTFNILTNFVGLSAVWASVFSFIAAIISNFTWNRYWTYPDSRSKPLGRQLIQFSFVSILGLLIRVPIIALLEPLFNRIFTDLAFLPVGFITAEFLANNLALAVAVIVVMFWNFFINRYWTYGDVE